MRFFSILLISICLTLAGTLFFPKKAIKKLKVIYIDKVHDSSGTKFQLHEVISLSDSQILHKMQHFIFEIRRSFSLEISIGKKGNIENVFMDIHGMPVPKVIDSFIKSFNYPICIDKFSKDTISYSIEWQFKIPKSYTKLAYLKELSKWNYSNLKDTELVVNFENRNPPLTMGKLYANKCYAFFHIEDDTFFYEYYLKHGQWEEKGRHKAIDSTYSECILEDLDGDGIKELINSTCENMNTNRWMDVYKYDSIKDIFVMAGSLSTYYTVKPELKEIWVEYSGSWYMPYIQEIKKWSGNKLLTKTSAILSLKNADMIHTEQELEVYENSYFQNGKDSLILKFKGDYKGKMVNVWNNFFK